MLRVLSIFVCAVVSLFVVYGVTYFIGATWGPLYESDADMNRNFMIYLVASFFFFVLGGFFGNHFYKKYLTKGSSGRKKRTA